MKRTSYSISCSDKVLRMLGDLHFISVNKKIAKKDVSTLLVDGVLEAGTLLNAECKPVTTTATESDAAFIVYQDIDFNNLINLDGAGKEDEQTMNVPVLIHGAVYKDQVKLDSTNGAVEMKAMPMIYFG